MSRITINAVANRATAVAAIAGALLLNTAAFGQPLGYASSGAPERSVFNQVLSEPGDARRESQLPAQLRRQVVAYQTHEAPGTVIIDTPNTRLFYVLGGGRAISYGIGVGRDGFTWSGVQSVTRKAEWPDWTPPEEMLQRQPYLPRFMAGGPGNPLGARAMYLGGTIYRIHGTNAPETIGTHVSSGCIRMLNEDVVDLYGRVSVGTKVVVLPDRARKQYQPVASSQPATPARPMIANSAPIPIRPFGLY
jgi:lipoprotein-anchoring transpeptidase ErfK/SrfK